MIDKTIIQERLASYQCKTYEDEENALKEITQEIALLALSRVDFFKAAEFHGGTALRILYNLQRFSEDLDFALLKPNRDFNFEYYLNKITQEFDTYGFDIEIKNRIKADSVIKQAFLKDDSIGKLLSLSYPLHEKNTRKIHIKLEVDTNPPLGATTEIKYLDFPLPFSVITKDIPSSFSGKIHALLCRKYIKGRDWYDFLWYIAKGATLNLTLLQNAIHQTGPWKKQILSIDKSWVIDQLNKKINTINWEMTKQDISRFIKPFEKKSLDLWSTNFFLTRVEKLK